MVETIAVIIKQFLDDWEGATQTKNSKFGEGVGRRATEIWQ